MPGDLRRNVLLAVEAIGEGITQLIHSSPAAIGGRPVTPDEILTEAIVAVYRLLFGLYAGARDTPLPADAGLIRLFDPAAHPLLSRVAVPGRALGRAIGLLKRSDRTDYGDLNVREFGAIYEMLLDYAPDESVAGTGFKLERRGRDSRRKRSGSYYTPEIVVAYIVGTTLGPLVRGECRPGTEPAPGTPLSSEEILKVKILDPAMGSGHFLIEAVDYLSRAYGEALARERGSSGALGQDVLAGYRRLVAEHCMYGVDVNPTAVEIAEMSLQLFAWAPGKLLPLLRPHLKCGDSLSGATFGRGFEGDPGAFHWALEFADVASGEAGSNLRTPGFDAVIGNPPYLSFSGRQKPKAAVVGGGDRSEEIPAAAPGRWPSLHGIFMTRSLELARERGLVSMIVPAQVGHLIGYGELRSRMMEIGELLEVRYWGEGVFEGVTTPSLTFLISKSRRGRGRSAVVIGENGDRVRFRPQGDEEWYSSASRKVCERMQMRHPALKTFSDPGVHTGNVAKRIILKMPGAGAVPVLEGRRVHPFRCDKPDRWLDPEYVPGEGEYFRIAPDHVYKDTDIILRQTADRPIAARHLYRCHFRNSVLALRVTEPFSVEYLLGVLNSDAVHWMYASLSCEARQRAFPQVKIHSLRRIPIPDPSAGPNMAKAAEITEIVSRIEAGAAPREGLLDGLNRLVWDLYGLDVRSPVLDG
jgi:hypothetical protein